MLDVTAVYLLDIHPNFSIHMASDLKRKRGDEQSDDEEVEQNAEIVKVLVSQTHRWTVTDVCAET